LTNCELGSRDEEAATNYFELLAQNVPEENEEYNKSSATFFWINI
jgi:hypothetical protein